MTEEKSEPTKTVRSLLGLEKPSTCKIVVVAGKTEKGYCVVNVEQPDKRVALFKIPDSDIYFGMKSLRLLDSGKKAFVAVPVLNPAGTFQILTLPDGTPYQMYALSPISEAEIPSYESGSINKKFLQAKKGGKGVYGEVTFHPTEQIAEKRSNREKDGSISMETMKEIAIYNLLGKIACQPKLIGFDTEPEKMNMQLELGVTTLLNIIKTLSHENIQLFSFRIAKCMRASASQGLIHLDLKPENMIITTEGKVQVIDWGLAEIDRSKSQNYLKNVNKQTLWWRSPEILCGIKNYTHKADIFSLGLIFLEMFTGKPVCPGYDDEDYAYLLLQLIGKRSSKPFVELKTILVERKRYVLKIREFIIENYRVPSEPADLISKMLEFNPSLRIDYDDIVLHPYYQSHQRERIGSLPIFVNNMPIIPGSTPWLSNSRRLELFRLLMNTNFYLEPWRSIDCLCLAFQLIDILFTVWKIENVQAIGYICFNIARKMFLDSLKLSDIEEIVGKPSKHLIELENQIVSALEGNLLFPTIFSYYEKDVGIKNKYYSDDEGSKRMAMMMVEIYSRPDVYERPIPETYEKVKAELV